MIVGILIRRAKCYRSDKWKKTDIRVVKGKILRIAERLEPLKGETVMDAAGKVLLPGLIDVHVHLREPGDEAKETIFTGSKAAARGGFTTIAAMPNTNPVADTAKKIKWLLAKAESEAIVNVHFYAAITQGLQGENLTKFHELKEAGAFALTDDGVGIQTAGQMLAAMRRAKALGFPIVAHCEDNSIAGNGVMHEGKVAERFGFPGIPEEAEAVHIVRDAFLAERTGVHYHVCHVSSASSVEAIREAKKRGIHVTAEVTPHHLVLTEDDIPGDDANFKMNPPLRSERDRLALIAGLLDGTIDFIATDHAPHTEAEKAGGFLHSPFGIIGLETAFPLMYTTLVKSGLMRLEQLVQRMSTIPAACFGLEGGAIREGAAADLTLVDLQKEQKVVPALFDSKSKNSPFLNWPLIGWPVWTMVNGRVVYDEMEESLVN